MNYSNNEINNRRVPNNGCMIRGFSGMIIFLVYSYLMFAMGQCSGRKSDESIKEKVKTEMAKSR